MPDHADLQFLINSHRDQQLPQFWVVHQFCHPILGLFYNFKSVRMTTNMIWKPLKSLFILRIRSDLAGVPCLLLLPDLSISSSAFPSPCSASSWSQHTTHTASHTHMCVCFSLPSGKTMKQEILILGNCPLKTCRSFLCHLFQEAFCNWPSYKWEFTPLNTIVLASYLHR